MIFEINLLTQLKRLTKNNIENRSSNIEVW
jgi:hypothetical protein